MWTRAYAGGVDPINDKCFDDDIIGLITILFREIVNPIIWFNDDIIVLMMILHDKLMCYALNG